MASPNVHQMADVPIDARLVSAFQNGALWRVDSNLPGGAPLENRGAALLAPSSSARRCTAWPLSRAQKALIIESAATGTGERFAS